MSDDGQHGLTIIGFVGSVFSPYYFQARRKGRGDPQNFCAINVALYGGRRRWAMTERGMNSVRREADNLSVGPSHIAWNGTTIAVSIHETCSPIPFPLKGKVLIHCGHVHDEPLKLDEEGRHWWQAVAPYARIEVLLENPALNWQGVAYHDMNWGNEPIENGFRQWTWQRSISDKAVTVLYDATRRDGSVNSFGRIYEERAVKQKDVPGFHSLPKGFWRMTRRVASERPPTLVATLEDTPFYTRNVVRIESQGEWQAAIHESLSLDRFVHPLVQKMLPFRMPRRA